MGINEAPETHNNCEIFNWPPIADSDFGFSAK